MVSVIISSIIVHTMSSLPVVRDALSMIDSGMLMQFANSFMTPRMDTIRSRLFKYILFV